MRTTVQEFLGLSIHCARCHDHKFESITRMDYFKTVAIFNPSVYHYDWPASSNEIAVYEANKAKMEKGLDQSPQGEDSATGSALL